MLLGAPSPALQAKIAEEASQAERIPLAVHSVHGPLAGAGGRSEGGAP